MEERFIVSMAKSGDRDAFLSLIASHEQKIYALCFKYMENEHDAKDAAQESILKAFVNINRFREDSAFSTWVYRITVNTCIDILRKRKNIVSIEEREESSTAYGPEDEVISREFLNGLSKAIRSLPEKYKTIIILKELEHKKYDEIAKILEISEGTVKSRLSRAREKLKYTLKKNHLM